MSTSSSGSSTFSTTGAFLASFFSSFFSAGLAPGAGPEVAAESYLNLWLIWSPMAAKFLKASMIKWGTATSVGIPTWRERAVTFLTPSLNLERMSEEERETISDPRMVPSS